MGWREFVGDAGRIVGLNHYGASAAYTVLYEEFGLTDEAVVAAARESIAGGASGSRRPGRPGRRAPAASPTPPATAEPTAVPDRSSPKGTSHGTERESGRAVRRRGRRLARRPVPRPHPQRQPAVAGRRVLRRRRHHQPDDLRRGDQRVGLLRRPAARPRRPQGERRGGAAHHHRRRRPRRLRPARGRSTTGSPATAGSPSRSPRAWRTTPTPPPPRPAHLWWLVDRPNLFIKIPATEAGLPAITETIANGISVNVTLIFSLERYRAVMDAYLAGLEKRVAERRLARGHRVGGVVLRLPRGHRDRQAAGQGRRRRRRSRARPASPTRSWPTRPTRRSSPPTAGGRSRRRAPRRSGRCGPRPASRTRSTRTRCTSASSSPPARSTPCRRRR